MSITAHHVSPQGGGFESQRAYNFWVELYGVPGQEVIKLAVASGFAPQESNDPITISYFGEERHVAGKAKFRAQSMTCVDYVDEPVLSSIMEWRKMVYDARSGAIKYATSYKKQAAVQMTDGEGGAMRTWQIEGIWPNSVTHGQFSYQSNDTAKVTVELTYDRSWLA